MNAGERIMGFKKILHRLDGSHASFEAFRKTLALATACGAEVHIVVVEKVPHYYGDVGDPDEAEQTVNTNSSRIADIAQEMARRENVSIKAHVVVGPYVKSLLRLISAEQCDLLVIASASREPTLCRRTSGKNARLRLVNRMPCSVLVVD